MLGLRQERLKGRGGHIQAVGLFGEGGMRGDAVRCSAVQGMRGDDARDAG